MKVTNKGQVTIPPHLRRRHGLLPRREVEFVDQPDGVLEDLGIVQKARPALILNRAFKESGGALISVVPHVTPLRGSDLEVQINVPFLRAGAFLVQNPVTVPTVKAERFLGKLTGQQLALVEAGVRDWFAL